MTFDQRYSAWTTCIQSADIKAWLGAPPASNMSMDKACNPCPLHNFATRTASASRARPGSVAYGNQCYPCEYGASSLNEMCIIG